MHLMHMVNLYPKHQFINLWQHVTRATVWEDFPQDTVLVEMDFAENLSIIVQDEEMGIHSQHKQTCVCEWSPSMTICHH